MRKRIPMLAVAVLAALAGTSRAVDLTLDSPTVAAGSQATVNVIWTGSAPLLNLSTEFIITAVGGAPVGAVTFDNVPIDATTGTPAVPPLSASNYVFSGDSDDLIVNPSLNPASVYTTDTNWAYDTYNFFDSTNSGTDYAQDGTRLWTILTLNTTGLAAGQYQITQGVGNSYDSGSSTGLVPTITGGLITITAVPEPSTVALVALASGTLALVARRRRHYAVQA